MFYLYQHFGKLRGGFPVLSLSSGCGKVLTNDELFTRSLRKKVSSVTEGISISPLFIEPQQLFG